MPDSHHLRAAQGWLELGDWRSANSELEQISPNARVHPEVLELRWHIFASAKDWPECVDIARALTEAAPDLAQPWIHHAFALHELKRTREAFDVLSSVADRFPAEATIPYNLACYSCQLGDHIGARDWLAQAYQLGGARRWKATAMADPDLAPLWEDDAEG
ncbi:MAG: tetratricopeptide repeat protein [Chloroflexota bacterium]